MAGVLHCDTGDFAEYHREHLQLRPTITQVGEARACACVHAYAYVYIPASQCTWGWGERTTCGSQLSPPIMQVPGCYLARQ